MVDRVLPTLFDCLLPCGELGGGKARKVGGFEVCAEAVYGEHEVGAPRSRCAVGFVGL